VQEKMSFERGNRRRRRANLIANERAVCDMPARTTSGHQLGSPCVHLHVPEFQLFNMILDFEYFRWR
jgi:hypothetical protein